tara:strand:+ start:1479 stop:1928 length:450 start_codon:yes stop_codon:yes gene_type:complete
MSNNSKQSKRLNDNLKIEVNKKSYPNPELMLQTCWNYKTCNLYDPWRDKSNKLKLEKFFSIVHNESEKILIATQQGAHAYPSSIATYKNINEINNYFGGKLCWNCHRKLDFWGGKGRKVRVNEENASYVQEIKANIMETFGEIYKYYEH